MMGDHLQFLDKIKDKRILIAPLHWGLGHATRCTPIITRLMEQNEILLASDGLAQRWLERRWPVLKAVSLPSYTIRYHRWLPMWLSMLIQLPSLQNALRAEQKTIQNIVHEQGIDIIVSDHRLGAYHHDIPSYLIAHQLRIPWTNPILAYIAKAIHRPYIERFDCCWIPDYEDHRMSGLLADLPLSIPKRYIGPISHISPHITSSNQKTIDVVILLSGPEPARTYTETILISALRYLVDMKVVLIRGTKEKDASADLPPHIKSYQLIESEDLTHILQSTYMVISRPGYSTLMDLDILGIPAILLPTPGQPEQEYLARWHAKNPRYLVIPESKITTSIVCSHLEHCKRLSK